MLLTWWGSFPGGGATLGDYAAVANVARALKERGIEHSILNCADVVFPETPTLDAAARDDGRHAVLVFVCGPLSMTRSMRRLLRRFKGLKKIAVGVSLLDGNPINSSFDEIVARDGTAGTTFDLALVYADSARPVPAHDNRSHVALCLRGRQNTYGRENCLSEVADAVLHAVAQDTGLPCSIIDTVIRPGNLAASIERGFDEARLIATTRMHGALFALVHRAPFVAIDQIRGGAKVSRILHQVGWKAAFMADALNPEAVEQAARDMIRSGWTADMEACRNRAVALSRSALDLGCDAIAAALGRIAEEGQRTER